MGQNTATRDEKNRAEQGESDAGPESQSGARAEDSSGEEAGEEARREGYIPVWEWIAGVVGLVLVVGTIGFLLYRAVTGGSSPPEVEISVEAITPIRSGYLVEVSVSNTGEGTAAELTLTGELRDGTEVVETSTVTLDYVPSQSSREAGLYFSEDPREFELSLRAEGYRAP
jgi:uncharacterized protein (TIGR02588 family)